MLTQRITADYIAAMKARETEKAGTLNFLRAQIKNVMVDKRVEDLDDAEVIAVIKKQVKQRHESIRQYREGKREDLAVKEERELAILQAYLPQEMGDAELAAAVAAAVAETGAKGPGDIGVVMKAVVARVAGRADNKRVSDLVRKSLTR